MVAEREREIRFLWVWITYVQAHSIIIIIIILYNYELTVFIKWEEIYVRGAHQKTKRRDDGISYVYYWRYAYNKATNTLPRFHSTHDLLSGFTSITVRRCQFWLLRKQLVIITVIFFSFINFSLSIFNNNNSNHI